MLKRLLVALLLALPALAQRSLYWDEVAVRAHLNADGSLRVTEEQTYVFDGEWNGGERVFRVEPHQTLTVHGITRRDPATGADHPMQYGSLAVKDGYELLDGNTLRWRARMPEDPPFRNERITYVIDYTLGGVLDERGSAYRLDHDFAFPDRDSEIRRFRAELTLDPALHAPDLPRRIERTSLEPGESAIVRGNLEYRGDAAPAAAPDTRPFRYALALLVLGIPVLLWRSMVRHEKRMGRLEPLSTRSITSAWIERYVLSIEPEVVGAAWDEAVGANEVSALISRWASENKVRTSEEAGELSMTLLVPRESFHGYERALIDKLFFEGDTTSTSAIKKHYESSGFDPSGIIQGGVQQKVDALLATGEKVKRPRKLISFALFIVTIALVVRTAKSGQGGDIFLFLVWTWVAGICWGVAAFGALAWRGRIDYGLEKTRTVRIAVGIVAVGSALVLLFDWVGRQAQLAMVAAALLVANNSFNCARSKRGPTAIAFRKRLASVRQYFVEELRKETPAIDDRWVPYVIAFGLDGEASTWMREFGARSASDSWSALSSSSGSSWSGSSSGSSSPRWTGGGGAFGGAGATGGWAAATAGMAAGVAAPSSSSGGSSGGGSSSGGGGGGGW